MSPDPNRRSEKSQRAIITAAFDLVAERGFAATTVEAIAAKAGVGKQTIYRWWPSKAAILLDGVAATRDASARFPDTGDIFVDLTTQTRNVMQLFSGEFGVVWRGLISAAQYDEAAEEGVRRIVRNAVEECVGRLAKARDAGQVRADLDLELAVEMIYGPLYHNFLLRTRPLPLSYMDDVLAALRPALSG